MEKMILKLQAVKIYGLSNFTDIVSSQRLKTFSIIVPEESGTIRFDNKPPSFLQAFKLKFALSKVFLNTSFKTNAYPHFYTIDDCIDNELQKEDEVLAKLSKYKYYITFVLEREIEIDESLIEGTKYLYMSRESIREKLQKFSSHTKKFVTYLVCVVFKEVRDNIAHDQVMNDVKNLPIAQIQNLLKRYFKIVFSTPSLRN